ncbi:MAG: hypothetical protein K6F43_04290 [Prevotella sp.]|nr:hypothetical protein [Prevotella sp.]
MKKFIMLSAVMAAVSTAFVACSSDDDLALAPAVPEETVIDTPKGTPFSVMPYSGATRADLYNKDAWDGTNDNFVSCFKLNGRQGTADPWVNDVVFTRSSKSAAWVAERDADGAISSLKWPKDNPATTEVVESATATDFYAITDNAIKDQANNNALDYVTNWMNPVGSFTYTLPAELVKIVWEDTNNPGSLTTGYLDPSDPDYVENPDVNIIKNADLKDLMVATVSHKESDAEVVDGALPLAFKHALAGLTIQAKFLSHGEYDSNSTQNGWAKVKAVAVCGLNTSGPYTFGTGWGTLSTPVNYYYELTTPEKFDVQDETDANKANPTTKTLVAAGNWLVIPQTTTPWDISYNSGLLPNPATCAYVILKLEDFKNVGTDFFLCYPLNTTLHAGKNRTIVIDIAQGRDYSYNTDDPDKCDMYYHPATIFGGAREFKMDE